MKNVRFRIFGETFFPLRPCQGLQSLLASDSMIDIAESRKIFSRVEKIQKLVKANLFKKAKFTW
jgi:hypothetical protein